MENDDGLEDKGLLVNVIPPQVIAHPLGDDDDVLAFAKPLEILHRQNAAIPAILLESREWPGTNDRPVQECLQPCDLQNGTQSSG